MLELAPGDCVFIWKCPAGLLKDRAAGCAATIAQGVGAYFRLFPDDASWYRH